ncbi:MAG: DMT family transporter [Eggerthellaceae bacterium]|jgi:drug/metabolite transporter (DMT)-like permease|nr:DMT family transporter [Eggerthellaceae bacterium]MDR2721845.1 DMT family transporter [Coriobacteriaceae bacterium]
MTPQIRALSGTGQRKLFGHLAVLTAMLLWGSTFAASKYLIEQGISPLEMLIARFLIAWLLMQFVPCAKLGFTNWRDEKYFIFAGLGGVTVYFLFENTALYFTYASNVGLITGISPLVIAAVFWLLFKEKPSKWFFFGSALAVFGVACVATNGAEIQMNLIGDFLAVLACLSWAGYTVAIRKIRTMERVMDDIAITRRIFFWGTLASFLLIPFSGTADFLFVGAPLQTWLQLEVIGPILYLSVLASCLCYVAMNFAMRVIGEVAASAYIYTIPAISIVAAHVLINEIVTLLAVVGMVAITVGLLISEEFWKRSQKGALPQDSFAIMDEEKQAETDEETQPKPKVSKAFTERNHHD